MRQTKFRPLIWLAVIGLLLYGVAILWSQMHGGSMDDMGNGHHVSKQKAEQTAIAFWQTKTNGLTPKVTTVYQTKERASAYIAKLNKTEAYEEQLGQKVPLEYWDVRLSDGVNEYIISVALKEATVTDWRILNGRTAIQFGDKQIADKTMLASGYSLNDFRYEAPDRAGQTGMHTYTSKQPVFEQSYLQVRMCIRGGQTISYQTDLLLPNQFNAWFDQQNRLSAQLSSGSLVVSICMAFAMFVYAIIKRRYISFSRGIVLALLFVAINIIHLYNAMPGTLATIDEQNRHPDLLFYTIMMVTLTLIMGVVVSLSAAVGDGLWREQNLNKWARWQEHGYGDHVWKSMIIGYLTCLFILGVQQALFAIAETSFHAFAIPDPSQSMFNLNAPILFPTLAWMAGISEEIIFRLFGIALLRKVLHNRFAAVLVSSFLWALGHAAYAVYPSYTRLIEVTILGVIFGYIFLRYGLIAAIFSHVIMDSILMGLTIMIGGNSLEIISGLVYMVLPLFVAAIIRFLHRRYHAAPT